MKKIALILAAFVFAAAAQAADKKDVKASKTLVSAQQKKESKKENPGQGCENSAFGQGKSAPQGNGPRCGNVSPS